METALLVAAAHEGDTRLAGEVRLRERVLGLTADARQAQRVRYVPAVDDSAVDRATVTSIASYRDL